MNKYLAVLAASAFLASGCKTKYEKGFDAGYDQGYGEGRAETYQQGYSNGVAAGSSGSGYSAGYSVGHEEGLNDSYDLYATAEYRSGLSEGKTSGYNQGYIDGENAGFEVGYSQGESAGATDGYNAGYSYGYADGEADGYEDNYTVNYNANYSIGVANGGAAGYENGYSDGYADGDADGYDRGYTHGYNDNYSQGETAGYSDGYDAGEADGYDYGYQEGYTDGTYDYDMGYAVKSSNPSVALAAKVNSDLIDFSSLPKFESNLEGGSIAYNHADGGTVDLEKLAALKEQHYLNAMGQQLQARFGMSSDSAKRVATVAHQFNKLAGSRALTAEDASAFSKDLIGFDMNQIEGAVRKSAKGESQELKALLKEAAGKLGTSPEKFNDMITEIFY